MSEKDGETEPKMYSAEEFERLKATNERVLAEHRADKAKFKDKLGVYEQKENDDAKNQNDYKALYETSQKKLGETLSDLSDTKMTAFEKNLTLEIASLAKDAHNPNAIMRALNINDANMDLNSGTLTDLVDQIDGLRKNEAYYFGAGEHSQTSTVPRYMKQEEAKPKALNEMSVSEIEKTLRERAKSK